MWDKYSCDKCNNYQLLSVMANHADSKSAFESWIQRKGGARCVSVCKADGGKALTDACGNGGWGGTSFFIKPDKSFKKYSSSDITNNGIKEHECNTEITLNSNTPKQRIVLKKTSDSYLLYAPFSDNCVVDIVNIHGQKVHSFVTSSATQWYALPNLNASGMHIITIRSSKGIISKKFWLIK